MAEVKKADSQPDPWKTDKSTWQYVAVPPENALGEVHANMGINKDVFEAGKTYLLPEKMADTLRERLSVYARSQVRILQPKRDSVAENAVAIGSANSRQLGASPVDPSHIITVG
jgi:hypothetical protein